MRRRKRSVTKLKHPLPYYDVPFEKHFEIIKAYVVISKEGKEALSCRDLRGSTSVSPNRVSANNKFFEDLGLIEKTEKGQGKYRPTEKAVEFSKAKDWDEEEAKRILRDIILESWFWQSTNELLSVKGGRVPKEKLINRLGLDSGADRKHTPALKVLLEYLKYVGLIDEEDGIITYGKAVLKQQSASKIEFPEGKDMIQVVIGDELFAIELKEFEMFVREKGRKLDKHIYRVKAG